MTTAVRAARANLTRVLAKVQAYASGAPERFIAVPDGVMIAFYPPAALARQLAVEGGEPASELHVTLALPGKLSELTPEQQKRLLDIVRGFALLSRPLEGVFGGVTTFPAHDGVKPVVLLVDVPGLPAWRQRLVEILALNGYSVASDHGYLPHLTLQYVPADAEVAVETPTVPLRFETITLVMGEKKRTWQLGGNPEVAEPLESFAAKPPNQSKEAAAVAAYQAALQAAYDDWAAAAWPQLVEAEDEDRDELLTALLLLLLTTLRRKGQEVLPKGLDLGLAKVSGAVTTTTMLGALGDALTANDRYLTTSLLPAIEAKLRAALLAGTEDVAEKIRAALGSFAGRVGQYAGELWKVIQRVTGLAIDERKNVVGGPDAPSDTRLVAILDPDAKHCGDCPRFHSERGMVYASFEAYLEATGDRVPGEFECGGNCRCRLEAAVD